MKSALGFGVNFFSLDRSAAAGRLEPKLSVSVRREASATVIFFFLRSVFYPGWIPLGASERGSREARGVGTKEAPSGEYFKKKCLTIFTR